VRPWSNGVVEYWKIGLVILRVLRVSVVKFQY
jgi:hypothetical protein